MKTFFFFGDSITLGVNDPAHGGFVGGFAHAIVDAGVPVPPTTVYNLGVRKQSSQAIQARWRAEFDARCIDGTQPYLVFCFGVVDMAAPAGSPLMSIVQSVACATTLIAEARQVAPVLIIAPPPVRATEHDARIEALTVAYAKLCSEQGVAFLDIRAWLEKHQALAAYKGDLRDGIHPETLGNALLTEALVSHEAVQGWIDQ